MSFALSRRYDLACIIAVVSFLFFTVALLLAAPSLLRYAFPALACACAVVLYARYKPGYVTFVMWLWFLSPFLRRLVDYRSTFVATSPLLLAPVLATGIAAWTLVTHSRALSRPGGVPFVCALGGILYGAIIGIMHFHAFDVAQALVNWVPPICFGFFLYEHREFYTEFRHSIETAFLWGVLLMGGYGVYQFFFLPQWDSYWMTSMVTGAFGEATSMKIRVFSTMNAPAPFATYMMAGLLMMFSMARSPLRIPAAVLGFIALLLTTDRACWLGLIVGVVYLAFHLPLRQRLQIMGMMIGCCILLGSLSIVPAINEIVVARFQSMLDPKSDVSYNARMEGHIKAFQQIAHEPAGEGLGTMDVNHDVYKREAKLGPHDSSIVEILYSLGYSGTAVYLFGLAYAAYRLTISTRIRDPFAVTMIAVTLSYAVQSVLNSILIGVLGFVVWLSIAMALAAHEHAEHAPSPQRLTNPSRMKRVPDHAHPACAQ